MQRTLEVQKTNILTLSKGLGRGLDILYVHFLTIIDVVYIRVWIIDDLNLTVKIKRKFGITTTLKIKPKTIFKRKTGHVVTVLFQSYAFKIPIITTKKPSDK